MKLILKVCEAQMLTGVKIHRDDFKLANSLEGQSVVASLR